LSKPVQEWLKGKKPEDIDLLEFGGRVFFPETIHRLKRAAKDGKGAQFEPVAVAVCVPRAPEKAFARRDAIKLAEKWKLDRDKDADLFDLIDKFALLAQAIRTPEEPHGQAFPLEWLVSAKEGEGFDERSLWALNERLQAYEDIIDPRVTEPMTEEEVMQAAIAINRVRNITPLVAMSGPALDSCVIGMASTLCKYRALLLSHSSGENSTPAP
jgi:hypothetical protein